MIAKFNNLAVKTKVILMLIIVAYLSIISVSTISYLVGTNIINKQIGIELDITIDNILTSINKLVYERQNDLQLLISDSILSDPKSEPNLKSEVLRNQLVKLGWYDQIHFLDLNGQVVASTNKKLIGENFTNKDWFIETKKSYTATSDVITLSSKTRPTIILGSIVANKQNDTSGIVATELSWPLIESLLEGDLTGLELYLYSNENAQIAPASNKANAPALEKITTEEYQKKYFTKLIVSEGYQSFNGNDWQLLAQIERKIAYKPIAAFTNYLSLTILLLSIAIYFLGSGFAQIFVKPIQKLTTGVGRVASGHLGDTINLSNSDEFGYLAKNFNKMSHSLLEQTNKLVEEKGKYKSILESSDEGISLIDHSGKIIAFNQKYCDLFKLKANQILGKEVLSVFKFMESQADLGDNRHQFMKMLKLLKKGDSKQTGQFQIVIHQPEYRVLQIYTGPVLLETGDTLGRIWSLRDVTAEYEAEKSKNDFIRVASHKLRTPITAIRWQSQLLSSQGQKSWPTAQKGLVQIEQHVEKLNSLAKQLMTAAEIQDEKLPLNIESFDLIELIKQEIEIASKTHLDQIKFKFSTRFKKIPVKLDRQKITQIVSAVIENSYYYKKPNKLANVKISIVALNKNKIELKFSDSGIGITADEQKQIFSKFFRGINAQHCYPDGSGISLYLAKIIVKSHGGKISLSGTENVGTEITVCLPIKH